jgi:myosin-5
MKQLMVDNNTAASHSFLLDDDSSIPFSLDDIAALMEDKAGFPFPMTWRRCVC